MPLVVHITTQSIVIDYFPSHYYFCTRLAWIKGVDIDSFRMKDSCSPVIIRPNISSFSIPRISLFRPQMSWHSRALWLIEFKWQSLHVKMDFKQNNKFRCWLMLKRLIYQLFNTLVFALLIRAYLRDESYFFLYILDSRCTNVFHDDWLRSESVINKLTFTYL